MVPARTLFRNEYNVDSPVNMYGISNGYPPVNTFSCQVNVPGGKVIFEPCYSSLFVFVALHPKSTAMVIVERSVQLITLFPGQA